MSRTDKDVPYRVHVTRTGKEAHDHRFGECDFEPRARRRNQIAVHGYFYRATCGLEISGRYSVTLKYFSRTKLQGWFAREYYDRDSSRLRQELGAVRKLHRAGENIEDVDVPVFQHRHWAEWERW